MSGRSRVYEWLDSNRDVVRNEDLPLLRNDFHALNIMADGRSMFVLDWTDAALGTAITISRTLAISISLRPWLVPPPSG